MTLEKTLIRRVVLLGAFALGTFAVITRLEAAQTPSPALLIAIEADHVLAIADPLTMKVVATVPTQDVPHLVAVSDDGKFAFVTTCKCGKGDNPDPRVHHERVMTLNNDYISVIDLVAQKEVRRVETGLGSQPQGIVFAGGKVYYTAGNYKLIGRYDPASNRIDWMQGTAQGHTHLLVITKDLKSIFTVNTSSHTVSAITSWDTPGVIMPPVWKVTTIPVGKGPQGIAMSPDEKEVWATTKQDGGLSIIDTATLKVKQTLNLHAEIPLRLQFTPDGKRVLIATEFEGDVLVLDAVTRKEIKRITVAKPEGYDTVVNDEGSYVLRNGVPVLANNMLHELLITPDGSRAYVPVMGSGYVAVIDMKTLEVTGRISVGSVGSVPKGVAWAVRR